MTLRGIDALALMATAQLATLTPCAGGCGWSKICPLHIDYSTDMVRFH
jgi:hypothetical protein